MPSNKLSEDIVSGIVLHLENFTNKNAKGKKRVIINPDIRSLRHLYNMYKESHTESGPSYTSFKRIFNEYSFAFPLDRMRSKPFARSNEEKSENKNESQTIEIQEYGEDDPSTDSLNDQSVKGGEVTKKESVHDNIQPKVIVTQVPDNSKFFSNPSQVYEIQIIEVPFQSIINT